MNVLLVQSAHHEKRGVPTIALKLDKPLARLLSLLTALLFSVVMLAGCDGAETSPELEGETDGAPFSPPQQVILSSFNRSAATGANNALIDVSSSAKGYVGAAATSNSRLKLQVTKNGQSMNYDMPSDGTPIIAPFDMGNGVYTVSVMQNTSGSRYAELYSTSVKVMLETEQSPYLVPNLYCDYTANSAVVAKARDLTRNAENEGDALRMIYAWIENNVTYDNAKAEQLNGKTGYIPNPDETLQTQTGICFDYASLAAAMLRSIGIPCQIITGYVSPNGVYHAWNMVWIDGEWHTASFSVNPHDWTRVDLTFAANGASDTIGDSSNYTQRYTY